MLSEKNTLRENLLAVEDRIETACKRAGRKRSEVTLVAVSKTKPVEMLREAYDWTSSDEQSQIHR